MTILRCVERGSVCLNTSPALSATLWLDSWRWPGSELLPPCSGITTVPLKLHYKYTPSVICFFYNLCVYLQYRLKLGKLKPTSQNYSHLNFNFSSFRLRWWSGFSAAKTSLEVSSSLFMKTDYFLCLSKSHLAAGRPCQSSNESQLHPHRTFMRLNYLNRSYFLLTENRLCL